MKPHSRRKFDQAYELVRSALETGRFDDQRWFPSNAALASIAGVSAYTIFQVKRLLTSEGLLSGGPGRRTSIARPSAGQQPPPLTRPARRSRSRDLQNAIGQDILSGGFAPEVALPSIKELAGRYGVCQPTLRKALRALVDESVLMRRSDAYYPLSLSDSSARSRSRIVLLGYGTNIGQTITWGYWHQEYLKLLEVECAGANIALDVICFYRSPVGVIEFHDGRAHPHSDAIAFTRNPAVLGYVFEVVGPESIDEELLRTVAGWGTPVAILDETGAWPPIALVKQHANIRVFRNTVSDQPARRVARYALELGHRTAAFISPDHGTEYSRRRYDGLAEVFAGVNGARLIPIVAGDAGSSVAPETTRVDLDGLMALYARWKSDVPLHYTRLLDQHFAMIPPIREAGRLREITDGLLRRALRLPEATIWIAVNDECAHCALDFLEDRRIPIPAEVAIISFDDTPSAVTLGITSYNFAQTSTATAMLRFITNPRLYAARKPIVEIEGCIIPRRTTSGGRLANGVG